MDQYETKYLTTRLFLKKICFGFDIKSVCHKILRGCKSSRKIGFIVRNNNVKCDAALLLNDLSDNYNFDIVSKSVKCTNGPIIRKFSMPA